MFVRNFFSRATKCGRLKTERGGEPVLTRYAGIAQSVEQLIRNQQVAGSSPVTSSNFSVTKVTEFFDFWRCLLMSEKEYRALRSALASTRMEGFEVTEQTERDCIRLLSGDISVADLVKEIVSRPAKAV